MSRLFWKFFFAFWLTILLIAVTAMGVIWLREQSEETAEQQLDKHASVFLASAASLAENGNTEALKNFLRDLDSLPFPVIYAFDSNKKEILNRNVDEELLKIIAEPTTIEQDGAVRLIKTSDQQTLLLVAVKPDFKPFNLVTLPPPKPINNPDRPPLHGPPPPKAPMIPPLMWLFIATLASITFSGLLAWYFTRPIRDLQSAFSEVAEGNLATRLSPITLNRKDEFSKLGKQFDEMVSKLQQLINSQQTLLNDVSHELRSPLARMQAAIGIAQQQPDKQLTTFERLETEIEHINELVGELLVLSQVDTADNLQVTEQADFVEIVGEIVDDGMYEGTDKGIQIHFTSTETIFIECYIKLLRRAIENVIRNAIKFSPDNGVIDVSIQKNTNSVILIISDQGPGIESQYLETMFEPFFHQGHENQSGTGLGLAIAYRAITKNKGTIKAQNNVDKGLSITIKLPILH